MELEWEHLCEHMGTIMGILLYTIWYVKSENNVSNNII